MTQAIPEGYHTITPSFTFKDSKKAIDFYQQAFGAEVLDLLPNPAGGGTMHATLKIGNSIIMMGDEMPGAQCAPSAETLGSSPIGLYVYVPTADKAFEQAVTAGATAMMPVTEMFWGDRMGQIKDPFGYSWMIATHQKDLNQEQIQQGAQEFFKQMSQQQK